MPDFKYEFLGNMLTVDELLGVLSGNTALGVTGTAAIVRVIRHLRDERDALRNAILPGPPMPNGHYVEIATAVAADRHNALLRANQAEQERDALRAAILPGARPGELANGNYVEAALQTESARRGALERALKAETERDGLQGRNDRQMVVIRDQDEKIGWMKDRIAELEAQIATANKVPVWNIERDGNGDVLVCRGDHERHEACDYERWVPIGCLEALSRDGEVKSETIDRQSVAIERFKELHDKALAKVDEITKDRDEARATIHEINKTNETLVKDNNVLNARNYVLRQKLKDIAYRAHVILDRTKDI